ncbi:hypothetical protein MVEN_02362000 [Mycena venus]|uniref:Uncharacterized protein n=1 Tax=Mycena venus TaxID=2733690 RepID=A0A8H7CDE2_9AGAR|nr:hypothetical protein MVEN_02362000 [Mycena venus]
MLDSNVSRRGSRDAQIDPSQSYVHVNADAFIPFEIFGSVEQIELNQVFQHMVPELNSSHSVLGVLLPDHITEFNNGFNANVNQNVLPNDSGTVDHPNQFPDLDFFPFSLEDDSFSTFNSNGLGTNFLDEFRANMNSDLPISMFADAGPASAEYDNYNFHNGLHISGKQSADDLEYISSPTIDLVASALGPGELVHGINSGMENRLWFAAIAKATPLAPPPLTLHSAGTEPDQSIANENVVDPQPEDDDIAPQDINLAFNERNIVTGKHRRTQSSRITDPNAADARPTKKGPMAFSSQSALPLCAKEDKSILSEPTLSQSSTMGMTKTSNKSAATAERTAAVAGCASHLACQAASTPVSDATADAPAPTKTTLQNTVLTPAAGLPIPATLPAPLEEVLADPAAHANVNLPDGAGAKEIGSPTPSAQQLLMSLTLSQSTPPPRPANTVMTNMPIYVHSETLSLCHGDFLPLCSPGFEPILSWAQKRKAKGKGKESTHNRCPPSPSLVTPVPSSPIPLLEEIPEDEDPDYTYAADMVRVTTMSLGQRTNTDGGASLPHRTATPSTPRPHDEPATPDSPSKKRQHADTNGHAVPRPTATVEDPQLALHPLTADRRRLCRTYTQELEGGFRKIYRVTESILFRNLPAAQRQLWDEANHPKLITTIAGGNSNRLETTASLHKHIANFFNLDLSEVSIGTPGLADHPGPDPIAWLITSLHVN